LLLRLLSVVSKQIGGRFGGLTRFTIIRERLSISRSGGVFASSSGPPTISLNTNARFSGRYPILYLPIRCSSILFESFPLLLFLHSDGVCSTGIGFGSCVHVSLCLYSLPCCCVIISPLVISFSILPLFVSLSVLFLLVLLLLPFYCCSPGRGRTINMFG